MYTIFKKCSRCFIISRITYNGMLRSSWKMKWYCISPPPYNSINGYCPWPRKTTSMCIRVLPPPPFYFQHLIYVVPTVYYALRVTLIDVRQNEQRFLCLVYIFSLPTNPQKFRIEINFRRFHEFAGQTRHIYVDDSLVIRSVSQYYVHCARPPYYRFWAEWGSYCYFGLF